MGHVVEVIGPDRFRTIPCPTYPEITLSLLPRRRLIRMIEAFKPDALHIATEGPLGHGGARLGEAHRLRLHHRLPHPLRRICPRAHRHCRCGRSMPGCAASTAPARAPWSPPPSLRDELAARGFRNIRAWSRGVDLELFKPCPARGLEPAGPDLPLCRPRGGGEEHRRLPRPGPAGLQGRGGRRARSWPRCGATIPSVLFTGPRYGEALARAYAGARRVRVPQS